MKKKKILFISPHMVHQASAMAGNQTFNYYLSRFTNDASFEVGYVVVFKEDDKEYKKMSDQFNDKARKFSIKSNIFLRTINYVIYNTKLRMLISLLVPGWYYMNPVYASFFLKGVKKAKSDKWIPDIVVLEWTESLFMYNKIVRIFPEAKYVCSEHDVAFVSVERRFSDKGIVWRHFAKRFKKKELSLLNKMDRIAVHNKTDFGRLLANGVSCEKIITISPYFSSYAVDIVVKSYSNTILFFGAMNRSENIHAVDWFIKEVFIAFNLNEHFNFIVVGGRGEALKEKYAHVSNVIFTGYVEDPTKYFATSLCMVAPVFYGAGIKVKVIEGMISLLPVLTTNIGIEGIEAKNKQDFFLCNTAEEFYNSIIELRNNQSLAALVGGNAAKFVESEFNYNLSYQLYKSQFN